MELNTKKEHIKRCVKLGMTRIDAYICSECSEKEIEELSLDIEFQKSLDVVEKVAEYELLMKHNNAMEIQLAEGKTKALEWKLAHTNPSRWESKKSIIIDDGNIDRRLPILKGVTPDNGQ